LSVKQIPLKFWTNVTRWSN